MTIPFESAVFLTVRGTCVPESLEVMRVLHNSTAGSEQGIAAARSLGDLSHVVYAPLLGIEHTGAKAGELLFLDWWDSPKGIMDFFGNEQVVKQGAKLFSARDATVWMPARGSSCYHLPVPKARTERYLGMVRGPVKSPQDGLKIFAEADTRAQRDARRRGLISHELFVKFNAPGDSSAPELLGVDLWSDFGGMMEHYADGTHMAGLRAVFSGPAHSTVWEQPRGSWSEW